MATGIRDKVAILGMGCSKFGERWDKEADDLMVEAFERPLPTPASRRTRSRRHGSPPAIEEQHVGKSGVPLAVALRLPYIPVTRVETLLRQRHGSVPRRGVCRGVRCGRYALALGVEKLKDTGYGGLPQRGRGALDSMSIGRTCRTGFIRPARGRLSRQARYEARRSSVPWRTSRSRATTTATAIPRRI